MHRIQPPADDPAHAYQERPPCPLAFLATDVANQEREVRTAYTQVFKRLAAFIDKELSGGEETGQQRALALSALMVGGVAVARALDDERTVLALLMWLAASRFSLAGRSSCSTRFSPAIWVKLTITPLDPVVLGAKREGCSD